MRTVVVPRLERGLDLRVRAFPRVVVLSDQQGRIVRAQQSHDHIGRAVRFDHVLAARGDREAESVLLTVLPDGRVHCGPVHFERGHIGRVLRVHGGDERLVRIGQRAC